MCFNKVIILLQIALAMMISRQDAMKKLGISSRVTIQNYCETAGLPPRLRSFTEEEFSKLRQVRDWCARGGRKQDFSWYIAKNPRIELTHAEG